MEEKKERENVEHDTSYKI